MLYKPIWPWKAYEAPIGLRCGIGDSIIFSLSSWKSLNASNLVTYHFTLKTKSEKMNQEEEDSHFFCIKYFSGPLAGWIRITLRCPNPLKHLISGMESGPWILHFDPAPHFTGLIVFITCSPKLSLTLQWATPLPSPGKSVPETSPFWLSAAFVYRVLLNFCF